ncbi:MAG TPA: carbon-nitrogen hydrolase family protein, partial [Myxococcota bacterium]|nr:carbon-nitrogen hydrolase family protein [Myxococcota bacterium]
STEDVAENLAAIAHWVGEAARAGATFVALPENACWLRVSPEAVCPKEVIPSERVGEGSGPILTALRRVAADNRVWLLVGSFPEVSPDPARIYNTSVLIDGTGAAAGPGEAGESRALGRVAATYRKLHLFDIDVKGSESQRESDTIAPGDRAVVTEVAGVPVGLSICYDLRFPELYRRLVDDGARVLTVPAAFTEFTGKDHWLVLLRARAIETQTFVIAPGQSGFHGGKRRTFGKSTIIDPWGIPLCIAADGPGFAVARLDFASQDRIRASLPNLQHRHPALNRGPTHRENA